MSSTHECFEHSLIDMSHHLFCEPVHLNPFASHDLIFTIFVGSKDRGCCSNSFEKLVNLCMEYFWSFLGKASRAVYHSESYYMKNLYVLEGSQFLHALMLQFCKNTAIPSFSLHQILPLLPHGLKSS